MAYIKVNVYELLDAAEQIEQYVDTLDAKMNRIDNIIISLHSEWKGTDYQQFKNEWNGINSSASTAGRMRAALKEYADSMRRTAGCYRDAQTRAINRAKTLCK